MSVGVATSPPHNALELSSSSSLVGYRGRMAVNGLDHVNIDTDRLDETIAFYTQVAGLRSEPKPSGNPGVWLFCGDVAIVHVNIVEGGTSPPTGRFNHVAFTASEVQPIQAALDAGGYRHHVSERPDLGLTQIKTTDPNGIDVEFNIAAPDC